MNEHTNRVTRRKSEVIIKWTLIAAICGTVFFAGLSFYLDHSRRVQMDVNKALAMVAEKGSHAVAVVDYRGIILDWSDGVDTMFNLKREAVVGRPITDFIPQEMQERHVTKFNEHIVEDDDRAVKVVECVLPLPPPGGPTKMVAIIRSTRDMKGRMLMVAAINRSKYVDLPKGQGKAQGKAQGKGNRE